MLRERAAEELFALMQNVSRAIYNRDWEPDLEFLLYEMILKGPTRINGIWLDRIDIDRLAYLSDRAQGWWIWHDELRKYCFVDLKAWREISEFPTNYL